MFSKISIPVLVAWPPTESSSPGSFRLIVVFVLQITKLVYVEKMIFPFVPLPATLENSLPPYRHPAQFF